MRFALRKELPSSCVEFNVTGDKESPKVPLRFNSLPSSTITVKSSKMNICTFVFINCLIMGTTSDFINFETTLDPDLINQKQIFLSRKERFIKFDTNDNELEVELGISIPFIKVPLTTGREVHGGSHESQISINAPGLIVAGMLMLTSLIIVPVLFTTSSEKGFGFQRKEKRDVWSVMENMNEVLSKSGFDSSSCMQKSICWVAKASKDGKDGSLGKWINYFLNTWWLNRLIGGTSVGDAVTAAHDEASCTAKYSDCSLTNKHLQSFVKMISSQGIK